MGEGDYYLLSGDQEQGPWTLAELQAFLQAGAVTLETLYARPGMTEWKPLCTILCAASPAAAELCPAAEASEVTVQRDRKLDDWIKANGRAASEATWGKAASEAFWRGEISGAELMRSGKPPSLEEFAEIEEVMSKKITNGGMRHTADKPSPAEKTGKAPGLQVGFSKIIESAVHGVAKAVEAGVFDELDQADKAIMGWRWIGVLDSEMCEQCQFYDGNRWTKDWQPVDDAPEFPGKPPLHRGCRCQLVAVNLGAEPLPKDTRLDDWLRAVEKRSPGGNRALFGRAALDAFERGEISVAELMKSVRVLSPDDLASLQQDPDVRAMLEGIK